MRMSLLHVILLTASISFFQASCGILDAGDWTLDARYQMLEHFGFRIV